MVKSSPLMGPSIMQAAQIRLWRSAAMKVIVFGLCLNLTFK